MIDIVHIGGQTSMFYENNGQLTAGSHFPLTFGEQDNEFISDKDFMLEDNRLREKKITMYMKH